MIRLSEKMLKNPSEYKWFRSFFDSEKSRKEKEIQYITFISVVKIAIKLVIEPETASYKKNMLESEINNADISLTYYL